MHWLNQSGLVSSAQIAQRQEMQKYGTPMKLKNPKPEPCSCLGRAVSSPPLRGLQSILAGRTISPFSVWLSFIIALVNATAARSGHRAYPTRRHLTAWFRLSSHMRPAMHPQNLLDHPFTVQTDAVVNINPVWDGFNL